MKHVGLIEAIKRSSRRGLVKSVGINGRVRVKKFYLVGLEFFLFFRNVCFVPLGFVFFGDISNRNGMGRNDGIGGAGRGCRRRRRSRRRGNRNGEKERRRRGRGERHR